MPKYATVALGEEIYSWACDLFPINRSLTGAGVRETLKYFQNILPDLTIYSVPSGKEVFDWVVPDEWEIKEAYIETPSGEKIADFKLNNLHVVGYSCPVDKVVSLEELQENLYSIPEMPDAIPYVTSYYRKKWGFCLTHKLREALVPGQYKVKIDSRHFKGELNYAEIVIPGDTSEEILFSSYICHPSMANDQLSGPCVLVALVRYLKSLDNRRYTYRIILIPENIGSLVYLDSWLDHLKVTVKAGLVIACVGDDRDYSMLYSREGNTLADRALHHVLLCHSDTFKTYDYLWPNRGSDERNFCSPGVDLPIASFMRSKYGVYPEYHTSLDNLSIVSPEGFLNSFIVLQKFVNLLENNYFYVNLIKGEPCLGKRNLYPTSTSHRSGFDKWISDLMNILAYADGKEDLLGIATKLKVNIEDLIPLVNKLESENIIKKQLKG